MSAPSDLADACMTCWPGDQPATLPHEVVPQEGHEGSLRASYRCDLGHEWVTWWDAEAAGWQPGRKEQAA